MQRILTHATLLTTLLSVGAAHAALAPGLNVDESLTHDGETRVYDVLQPAGYDGSSPVPLVVDLHGFTGTKTAQRATSGFAALAEAETFLVAWPQALGSGGSVFNNTGGPAWNAGGGCCGDPGAQDEDDVGFIRAMVAAIVAEANVDQQRIYVTGLSNGGALVHRLACEASDLFAAAASFSFPTSLVAPCVPPIPILMVASRTDTVVPYNGGLPLGSPAYDPVPSAADGFEEWRVRNGCTGASPDVVESQGGTSVCELYTSCDGGVRTALCSVDADPLVFDGHVPYSPNVSGGFNPEEYAWDFLSSYPSAPVCGDGAAGAGEECDDGNTLSGDGCSSTCTIEVAAVPGSSPWSVALLVALLLAAGMSARRRSLVDPGRPGR